MLSFLFSHVILFFWSFISILYSYDIFVCYYYVSSFVCLCYSCCCFIVSCYSCSCIYFILVIILYTPKSSEIMDKLSVILKYIFSSVSESQWKFIQDSLQYCGFLNEIRTATYCFSYSEDCSLYITNRFPSFFIIILISSFPLLVVFVIITFASCFRIQALFFTLTI